MKSSSSCSTGRRRPGKAGGAVIIDAWMQHPSAEFPAEPMFDSLQRWARGHLAEGEIPVEPTRRGSSAVRPGAAARSSSAKKGLPPERATMA
jgi:hypothetical protein